MSSGRDVLVPILTFFALFFFISHNDHSLRPQYELKTSKPFDGGESHTHNPEYFPNPKAESESIPPKPNQPNVWTSPSVHAKTSPQPKETGDINHKSNGLVNPKDSGDGNHKSTVLVIPKKSADDNYNKETDDPDLSCPVGPRDKRGIDVVVVSLEPTCTDKDVVAGLLNYLDPIPRSIVYISKQLNCKVYRSLHSSVLCVDEDTLIPGMNYNKIKEVYLSMHARHHRGRKGASKELRHGWYFQQYLKWGAVVHLNVTDWILVWDSDMVLLRPYKVLDQDRKIHYFDQGGYAAPSFKLHYEALLPSQKYFKYFVTHHMVMYRPILLQLINLLYAAETNWETVLEQIIAGKQYDHVPADWCWKFLKYTRNWKMRELFEGWTEYGFYSAFVHQNYPELVQDVRTKWRRDAQDPACCPNFTFDMESGMSYVGVERGYPHRRWVLCHNHPEGWKILS